MSTTTETTHMRIPINVKGQLEELQERFFVRYNYEVIEKLIQSLKSFDRFRDEKRAEKQKEVERQEREMLDVGEEAKESFEEIKNRLNIRSDAELLGLLICHFETSLTVSMTTLEYFAQGGSRTK